jgi:hypothetical protein
MQAVGNNGHQGEKPSARASGAPSRRRTPWPLAVIAILFVVVPFLTWYLTWFGRSLDDKQIDEYLREGNPRHAQHALSQIAEQIEKGEEGARRWYPQITALAASREPDVRMTAAWVMGEEHKSEEFHAALVRLVEDPEPIVRRNAALALVRYGDPRCRAELLAMLRPYAVGADAGGTAITALTVGTPVKRGSLLVKFRDASGGVEEVRSPLPGTIEKASVKDGEEFSKAGDLFSLAPDAGQVENALVGLFYLGGAQELPDVERFAGGVKGMPDELKEKAAQAAEAIKRRAAEGK